MILTRHLCKTKNHAKFTSTLMSGGVLFRGFDSSFAKNSLYLPVSIMTEPLKILMLTISNIQEAGELY